jgi:hypothetical protein
MLRKKKAKRTKAASNKATIASVTKVMALPRIAESAHTKIAKPGNRKL